jgi:hypothetical protein
MEHALKSLSVGAIAAVVTFLIDPTPSWWVVGLTVAASLYVNPCPRR